MAAPERITRARALLAFRLLDKVLAEAAEAGKVPPAGSRWLDGDTAENARALFTWFSQQPEVKAAARNVADPDHAMIQYVRSVLEHFAFDRPQTAGGDPTPWREPVSSSLVRWRGWAKRRGCARRSRSPARRRGAGPVRRGAGRPAPVPGRGRRRSRSVSGDRPRRLMHAPANRRPSQSNQPRASRLKVELNRRTWTRWRSATRGG